MASLLSRASLLLRYPFLPKFPTHLSLFNHSLHTNPGLVDHFLSLLSLSQKSQDLKSLNSLLTLHGLFKHKSLVKQFINQCCHLGCPDLALSAFRTIEKPSLYLQNLLLRSLCDNGFFEAVVFVYTSCRKSGVSSDNYTYPFVMKACTALCDVWFGNVVHCAVLKCGLGENLVVQTAILGFYSRVGEMGSALKVVGEIPQPDVVTWNTLISGYFINGFDYEALQVFRDIRGMGVRLNASTFASVLPVCSRSAYNVVGISLHGLAYKFGFIEEEYLLPALVSMYSKCGDLLSAKEIFNTSTRKDVAIWSAMISAYTQSHNPDNALAVFQTMLLNDIKPNALTLVSLLPSSENLGTMKSFHGYVVKYGYEKELSVVTALISAYAKLGNMDSAEFLFHNIKARSLLLWNSMLSAYVGHGFCNQSLEFFSLMQMDGFVPDAISIISLLSSCSELKAARQGKSAHAFAMKKTINSNLNVLNALLAFYCNCYELAYSVRIFDRMVSKDVVSWSTIVSGCVDNGELDRAMLLLHHMRKGGVNLDSITLISILRSCHECQIPQLGLSIHGYSIRTAMTTDISLANAIISMYTNCGELDAARLFFDDMPDKSVVSWNAILTGYRYHNLHKETMELFRDMVDEDQKPNNVTLLNVLPLCEVLDQGQSIHAYMTRRMIPLETHLLTSLMFMYARFVKPKSCLTLFHIGDKTSISLWNTIISAHLLLKNGGMAFSYFCELLRSETEPDHITVLHLISVCVHLNNLHVSNSALAYLVKKGFDKDVATSNSLIDMYAKCGSISSARMLFEALPHKDTVSWSIMINSYGLHGFGEAALNLYSQMRVLGFKPDKVTYMSILSACSHGGCVEQGKVVFDSMIHDGIKPGMEHYGCMVDMLGRTGHLNKAYEIVKNVPCKPSRNLLESLLGACLSHGNYELGEEIGRIVVDMKPNDSGAYVILHNIYAAQGKWEDANNVRMLMELNQFSKAAGISVVHTNMYMP